MRGAFDSEVRIIVEKLVERGTPLDTTELYNALQRSNSSLKRRPKKTLLASLDRVIDSLRDPNQEDSEAEIENRNPKIDPSADEMNRSLRANLASPAQSNLVTSDSTTAMNTSREMDVPTRSATGEALPKRARRTHEGKLNTDPPDHVSLDDIGGMADVIKQLEKLVARPIQAPEIFASMDFKPSQGVLLHGPPGCGKTMISRALAAELGKPFIEILGPAVVSSMSGESEKALRERFEEAKRQAPCLIFIDEIDAIAPKRDSSYGQMEKRLVAQLLVSMDDLQKEPTKPVIVLAATNRPDSLDPALRRGGRFGSEINIGVPDEEMRRRILQVQLRKKPVAADLDFSALAKMTAGFVGADLTDLVSKAGSRLLDKYFEGLGAQTKELGIVIPRAELRAPEVLSIARLVARTSMPHIPNPPGFEKLALSMDDFIAVLPTITPSSKREGFATVPDVSWDDVGALDEVREALTQAIVWPIQEPELFANLGLTAPSGVLLWGPPGCGKTLLAKAAAAESKANFIAIKGPELLSKFVGDSEAAVRKVFSRARSSIPCVIFFDELDALVPKRDGNGSEAGARVVNALLTELDGTSERKGIYIVAATNRPDTIDPAMLRPGRLGESLFVDVPGPEERVAIFRTLARTKPCEVTPAVEELLRSPACEGYSGADIGALLVKGGANALRRRRGEIDLEDLTEAVKKVKVSIRDAERYRAMKEVLFN